MISEALGPDIVLVIRSLCLDLNEVTASLSSSVFGSEFQTAGAVQQKARFAVIVLVNGRLSVDVDDQVENVLRLLEQEMEIGRR